MLAALLKRQWANSGGVIKSGLITAPPYSWRYDACDKLQTSHGDEAGQR